MRVYPSLEFVLNYINFLTLEVTFSFCSARLAPLAHESAHIQGSCLTLLQQSKHGGATLNKQQTARIP